MKRYEIDMGIKCGLLIEVEADSINEARDKAYKIARDTANEGLEGTGMNYHDCDIYDINSYEDEE